jgi:hypothetical protein
MIEYKIEATVKCVVELPSDWDPRSFIDEALYQAEDEFSFGPHQHLSMKLKKLVVLKKKKMKDRDEE